VATSHYYHMQLREVLSENLQEGLKKVGRGGDRFANQSFPPLNKKLEDDDDSNNRQTVALLNHRQPRILSLISSRF
jgi:hypothetical protein